MEFKSFDVPESKCPVCGKLFLLATAMEPEDESGPQPGNPSICWQCGTVLLYMEDLSMKEATPEEIQAFSQEYQDEIMHYRNMVLQKIYSRK